MQGAVDLGQQRIVFGVVQVEHAERVLESGEPRLGRLDAPSVLVGVEVDAGRKLRNERGNLSAPRLARLGPFRRATSRPSRAMSASGSSNARRSRSTGEPPRRASRWRHPMRLRTRGPTRGDAVMETSRGFTRTRGGPPPHGGRLAGRRDDGSYAWANREGGARDGAVARRERGRSSRCAAMRRLTRTARSAHRSHSGVSRAASSPATDAVMAANTTRPTHSQVSDLCTWIMALVRRWRGSRPKSERPRYVPYGHSPSTTDMIAIDATW